MPRARTHQLRFFSIFQHALILFLAQNVYLVDTLVRYAHIPWSSVNNTVLADSASLFLSQCAGMCGIAAHG